jgi:CheY-like chemotaxis protein
MSDLESVGRRILVVDDSGSFRRSAEQLLTLRGFEVLSCVPDGASAMDAVLRGCPDGVLLDVHLPGMDGLAVAALLADACPTARIVLTSSEVLDARVHLAGCPVVAFVPKEELAVADLDRLWG